MDKKSPFYYYALHYKRYEEENGRHFPNGLIDVLEECECYWSSLTEEEKIPYCEMVEEKMDYKEKAIPASKEKCIENIIKRCYEEDRLDTTPFFIISFNYFLEICDNDYFPCEMGVVRFSIKRGLTKKLHSLINPGMLPAGFEEIAKKYAKRTHKLPIPPHAIGDTNYGEILKTLTDFLADGNQHKPDQVYPVLVFEDEMETVGNILTQFCEAAGVDVEQFVLLPLTYFFRKLREYCEVYYKYMPTDEFTYEVAAKHLNRFKDKYCNGCIHHELENGNIYCAVSRVTRAAYAILDKTADVCYVKKRRMGSHFPIKRYSEELQEYYGFSPSSSSSESKIIVLE